MIGCTLKPMIYLRDAALVAFAPVSGPTLPSTTDFCHCRLSGGKIATRLIQISGDIDAAWFLVSHSATTYPGAIATANKTPRRSSAQLSDDSSRK